MFTEPAPRIEAVMPEPGNRFIQLGQRRQFHSMTANKANSERGTVVVEAAFTMLLLFTFLLGLMEVGRFISVQQVITDAAREGARTTVAPYSNTSFLIEDDGKRAACEFLTAASVTQSADGCLLGAGATVTADANTACGTEVCTKVTVQVPYQLVTLSMFSNFAITLKAEALMRNETSP